MTTFAILTVLSSLTNILSHPHRHRHHQAAGTVPVKGSSSDDFCDSYDSIESDENPATPAPPPPPPRLRLRLRGLSPRRGRTATTFAILTVLSSLTKILPPPHRHRHRHTATPPPPRLRGLSPRRGRAVTTIAILTILSSLPNDPATPIG
ncbi:MAG UNVERIFIED_CONTAM: hypothetical protein LVR18_12490 [Planctomycetaceae bacterium]